jgi:hypothetical protein
MVRIENADAKGFVELVLDAAPAGSDEDSLEQVERNIQAAGTIVRDLTQMEFTVRLVTSPTKVFEARDVRSAMPLLDHLALIDPIEERASSPPLGQSARAVLIGSRTRARLGDYQLHVPKAVSDKNKAVV